MISAVVLYPISELLTAMYVLKEHLVRSSDYIALDNRD
jgi:hypothetical protein